MISLHEYRANKEIHDLFINHVIAKLKIYYGIYMDLPSSCILDQMNSIYNTTVLLFLMSSSHLYLDLRNSVSLSVKHLSSPLCDTDPANHILLV